LRREKNKKPSKSKIIRDTGHLCLIYKFNSIPWPLMKVIAFIVAFAVAALIRILISKIFG